MAIERIELRLVEMPLRTPFVSAGGSVTRRPLILVRLEADGVGGWGEAGPLAQVGYLDETVDTVWAALSERIGPSLLGCPAGDPAQVDPTAGGPLARAAAETALWDVRARIHNRPLAEELGGARRPVPAGLAIGGHEDLAVLLQEVEAAVAAGYRRVKIKVEPGHDREPLAAVRERFPQLALAADANGSYRRRDLEAVTALDEVGLQFLEQPLPAADVEGHAAWARRLATPICLDESIGDASSAAVALEAGAAGVVNLKWSRVGGHAEARAVHDLAARHQAELWCGGMLESGIGKAHSVALASLPGVTLPGDLAASSDRWDRDLVDPPWELADGHLEVPAGPGLGVAVDEELVEHLTIRSAVVR